MTNSFLWRQTGGVWPLGISTSVTWYDLGAITALLYKEKIRSIVEIGVEHGGLSAFLLAYCRNADPLMSYLGIDNNLSRLDKTVADDYVGEFQQRDAWLPDTVREVQRWIEAHFAPALILCDGGDKPRELKLYAPILRPGDILLGHDYHNEYTDAELADMPPSVVQVRSDWLDDTLLCAFVRRDA